MKFQYFFYTISQIFFLILKLLYYFHLIIFADFGSSYLYFDFKFLKFYFLQNVIFHYVYNFMKI